MACRRFGLRGHTWWLGAMLLIIASVPGAHGQAEGLDAREPALYLMASGSGFQVDTWLTSYPPANNDSTLRVEPTLAGDEAVETFWWNEPPVLWTLPAGSTIHMEATFEGIDAMVPFADADPETDPSLVGRFWVRGELWNGTLGDDTAPSPTRPAPASGRLGGMTHSWPYTEAPSGPQTLTFSFETTREATFDPSTDPNGMHVRFTVGGGRAAEGGSPVGILLGSQEVPSRVVIDGLPWDAYRVAEQADRDAERCREIVLAGGSCVEPEPGDNATGNASRPVPGPGVAAVLALGGLIGTSFLRGRSETADRAEHPTMDPCRRRRRIDRTRFTKIGLCAFIVVLVAPVAAVHTGAQEADAQGEPWLYLWTDDNRFNAPARLTTFPPNETHETQPVEPRLIGDQSEKSFFWTTPPERWALERGAAVDAVVWIDDLDGFFPAADPRPEGDPELSGHIWVRVILTNGLRQGDAIAGFTGEEPSHWLGHDTIAWRYDQVPSGPQELAFAFETTKGFVFGPNKEGSHMDLTVVIGGGRAPEGGAHSRILVGSLEHPSRLYVEGLPWAAYRAQEQVARSEAQCRADALAGLPCIAEEQPEASEDQDAPAAPLALVLGSTVALGWCRRLRCAGR